MVLDNLKNALVITFHIHLCGRDEELKPDRPLRTAALELDFKPELARLVDKTHFSKEHSPSAVEPLRHIIQVMPNFNRFLVKVLQVLVKLDVKEIDWRLKDDRQFLKARTGLNILFGQHGSI